MKMNGWKNTLNGLGKKLSKLYQQLSIMATMLPKLKQMNLPIKSHLMRVGLLAALLMILPGMCAYAADPTPAPGAGGGSATVESVAKNAFDTIYSKWRLPICGLLFFAAIFFYFQGGEQGGLKAIGIIIGMVLWALVPYFKEIVFGWFGDSATTTK